MRINFDYVTKENIKAHNPNWPQVLDHPKRILIIGSLVSRKSNSLFKSISHQPDIEKFVYMLKIHLKQNINYSDYMDDIYKNIEECNPNIDCF